MWAKPSSLFARDREWASLAGFLSSSAPGLQLAVVYGRRRQGKSLLLQELALVSGGFYWEAAQQSRAQNLASFSSAWARFVGSSGVRFVDWEEALAVALAAQTSGPFLLDEVGYLVETAPEFPSLLQRHLGPLSQSGHPKRIVLCGSVFAQMTRLLAAGAPLRGRHHLQLRVDPFDYRTAAAYWGLSANTEAAFELHSLVGGTPAYLRYVGGQTPANSTIGAWAIANLLAPTSPLFHEGELLVAEDPTLVDKALYWSVLAAVAQGGRGRSDIAHAIERSPTALSQPLRTLAEGAWLELRQDPLHRKATRLLLTEPLLRTERVLIAPERLRLERGHAQAVWEDAQPRLGRLVYGPHLEWLASEWVLSHASAETVGGAVNLAGSSVLRAGGETHQVDLVAVDPGARDGGRVCAVGEVKATNEPVGIDQLARLDHIVALLGSARAAATVRRLLVSRRGFTSELKRLARSRNDVELVDLHRLYRGT